MTLHPSLFLTALALILISVPPVLGHDRAHDRGRVVAVAPAYAPDPIQGVGCYWARQRMLCSRHCYWQPDGRRYCVERERQARREHVPVYYALPSYDRHGRPMK